MDTKANHKARERILGSIVLETFFLFRKFYDNLFFGTTQNLVPQTSLRLESTLHHFVAKVPLNEIHHFPHLNSALNLL